MERMESAGKRDRGSESKHYKGRTRTRAKNNGTMAACEIGENGERKKKARESRKDWGVER